ncbi:YhzD family protein [Pontibacillus litoralis]|uniref:YhzD-like protein n=1 Tax=Pontibacillus litoralis JSM 072002 TaxID=1385512 RepID=A0A0A5FWV2_9BACI|nr:YhzD family protein [Pontibacillus litoralis]KGX85286.1 hypothetical protein N784_09605 [Pontibacillus litoralis JSM 072002]
MKNYFLTVFAPDGSSLLDETVQASSDQEAKELGHKKLDEQGYTEHTHRLVAPEGHMVLFHR